MIRQRGGATRRRNDQDEGPNSSAQEIGLLLREAREERGLDLLAVHDRLSRPITQLEALERGDLASLPDQALALSTLRRYAAFIGLDGDALALRMIDAWSAQPAATDGVPRHDDGAPVTNVVAAVTAGPDHLRAFTQTGQVPRVGAGSTAAGPAATATGWPPAPPPGPSRWSPGRSSARASGPWPGPGGKLRAPRSLKIITWLTGLLVLAVVAGFVILRTAATVAGSAHILRVVDPGGPNPAHRPPPPPSPTRRPSLCRPVPPAGCQLHRQHHELRRGDHHHRALLGAGDQHAVVGTAIVGVQPAGKHLSFPAQGTMTVQVGSSAGRGGRHGQGQGGVLQRTPHHPLHLRVRPRPLALIPDRPGSLDHDGGPGAVPLAARPFGIQLGVVARHPSAPHPDPLHEHRNQGQEGENSAPIQRIPPPRGCSPPCRWKPPGGCAEQGEGQERLDGHADQQADQFDPVVHGPVRDGIEPHDGPPEQRGGQQEGQVDQVHDPHVLHGESQGEREEEGEHGEVVGDHTGTGWVTTRNGRELRTPRRCTLVSRLEVWRAEGHRCAHGQEGRRHHHQQQVLDHVSLKELHGEGGDRRLQRHVEGDQSDQERCGALPLQCRPRAARLARARRYQAADTITTARTRTGNGLNSQWVRAVWASRGTYLIPGIPSIDLPSGTDPAYRAWTGPPTRVPSEHEDEHEAHGHAHGDVTSRLEAGGQPAVRRSPGITAAGWEGARCPPAGPRRGGPDRWRCLRRRSRPGPPASPGARTVRCRRVPRHPT